MELVVHVDETFPMHDDSYLKVDSNDTINCVEAHD